MPVPSQSQVATKRPDGTQVRWLGQLGHVVSLKQSFTVPGGCDQMSCVLQADPSLRTEALNPGRTVQVWRGGAVQWDGQLDEPSPGGDGWSVTAHGSGGFAQQYVADYSGAWNAAAVDNVIDSAVGRGLRWVNPGVGSPAGEWLGQRPDPGSVTVADVLNTVTFKGGLIWQVQCLPRGNRLNVTTVPTAVTRLLIARGPVGRTLGGDVNAVALRYQVTADTNKHPAGYALTWATDANSIAKHGRTETFADLSSTGVLTAAQAQAVGTFVLSRYQRASFAGPFDVAPGDYLTAGGAPVDLGCEQAGEVVRVLMTDPSYGGEVKPGPVEFMVGGFEYDDDTGAASVAPAQLLRTDFAGMLAMRAETWHPRRLILPSPTIPPHHSKYRFA